MHIMLELYCVTVLYNLLLYIFNCIVSSCFHCCCDVIVEEEVDESILGAVTHLFCSQFAQIFWLHLESDGVCKFAEYVNPKYLVDFKYWFATMFLRVDLKVNE